MEHQIRVVDYMDRFPATIRVDMNAKQVVKELVAHGAMGAPVIDDRKHVVGFVSEQDIIHKVVLASYHGDTAPPIEELMRRDVLTVSAGDNILDLARQMEDKKPKVYPVVNEDNVLLGVIDRSMVLRALVENLDEHHPW